MLAPSACNAAAPIIITASYASDWKIPALQTSSALQSSEKVPAPEAALGFVARTPLAALESV